MLCIPRLIESLVSVAHSVHDEVVWEIILCYKVIM